MNSRVLLLLSCIALKQIDVHAASSERDAEFRRLDLVLHLQCLSASRISFHLLISSSQLTMLCI